MKKVVFTSDSRESVQDFCCARPGQHEEAWEIDVSNYIKSEDPFYDMAVYGTRVWLYYNDDNQQIGYGSLGTTRWPEKGGVSKKQRMRINLIPYLGLRGEFRGQPQGGRELHYSTLLLRDLEYEASQVTEFNGEKVLPFLGLFVDPRNKAAKVFYEWYGFETFPHRSRGLTPDIQNEAMILALNTERARGGTIFGG